MDNDGQDKDAAMGWLVLVMNGLVDENLGLAILELTRIWDPQRLK
jgi:hypothetical protein